MPDINNNNYGQIDPNKYFYDKKSGKYYDKSNGAELVSQQEYDQQQKMKGQFTNFVNSFDNIEDFVKLNNAILGGAGDVRRQDMMSTNYFQAPEGYGESKYDENYGVTQFKYGSQYEDLEDARAYNQSAIAKLGAGLVRMTGLAATSFVSGTVGLAKGIWDMTASMFDENSTFRDSITELFDNRVTNAMDSAQKWIEKEVPVYRTAEGRRNSGNGQWYKNMFSGDAAAFWSDDFVKNIGFTLGAVGSGALIGKVMSWAGKGVNSLKTMAQMRNSKAFSHAGREAFRATRATENLNKAHSFLEESQALKNIKESPKMSEAFRTKNLSLLNDEEKAIVVPILEKYKDATSIEKLQRTIANNYGAHVGDVVSKAERMAMNTINNPYNINTNGFMSTLGNGMLMSVGESGMEAREVKRKIIEDGQRELDEQKRYLEENWDKRFDFINLDKDSAMKKIEADYAEKMKTINDNANKAAILTFAQNMAILSPENIALYGRFLKTRRIGTNTKLLQRQINNNASKIAGKRLSTVEANSMASNIEQKAMLNGRNSLSQEEKIILDAKKKQDIYRNSIKPENNVEIEGNWNEGYKPKGEEKWWSKGIKTGLWEGLYEEGMQKGASTGATNAFQRTQYLHLYDNVMDCYRDNYNSLDNDEISVLSHYKAGHDKNAMKDTLGTVLNVLDGYASTYTDVSNYEDMVVGFLTGFIGLPLKGGQGVLGHIADAKERKQTMAVAQALSDQMNEFAKNGANESTIRKMIKDALYSKKIEDALLSGDVEGVKTNEYKMLIDLAESMKNNGKLGMVYEMIDSALNTGSADNIIEIAKNTGDTYIDGVTDENGRQITQNDLDSLDETKDSNVINKIAENINSRKNEIKKTIDTYMSTRDMFKAMYGDSVSDDVLDMLTYWRMMIDHTSERQDKIVSNNIIGKQDKLNKLFEDYKSSISEKQNEYNEYRNTYESIKQEREKAVSSEFDNARNKISETNTKIQNVKSDIDLLNNQLELNKSQANDKLSDEKNRFDSENSEIENKYNNEINEINKLTKENDVLIDKKKKELSEVNQKISKLRKRKPKDDSTRDKINNEISELEDKKKTITEELDEFKERKKELKNEIKNINKEKRKELNENKKKNKDSISKINEQHKYKENALNNKKNEKNNEIQKLNNDLKYYDEFLAKEEEYNNKEVSEDDVLEKLGKNKNEDTKKYHELASNGKEYEDAITTLFDGLLGDSDKVKSAINNKDLEYIIDTLLTAIVNSNDKFKKELIDKLLVVYKNKFNNIVPDEFFKWSKTDEGEEAKRNIAISMLDKYPEYEYIKDLIQSLFDNNKLKRLYDVYNKYFDEHVKDPNKLQNKIDEENKRQEEENALAGSLKGSVIDDLNNSNVNSNEDDLYNFFVDEFNKYLSEYLKDNEDKDILSFVNSFKQVRTIYDNLSENAKSKFSKELLNKILDNSFYDALNKLSGLIVSTNNENLSDETKKGIIKAFVDRFSNTKINNQKNTFRNLDSSVWQPIGDEEQEILNHAENIYNNNSVVNNTVTTEAPVSTEKPVTPIDEVNEEQVKSGKNASPDSSNEEPDFFSKFDNISSEEGALRQKQSEEAENQLQEQQQSADTTNTSENESNNNQEQTTNVDITTTSEQSLPTEQAQQTTEEQQDNNNASVDTSEQISVSTEEQNSSTVNNEEEQPIINDNDVSDTQDDNSINKEQQIKSQEEINANRLEEIKTSFSKSLKIIINTRGMILSDRNIDDVLKELESLPNERLSKNDKDIAKELLEKLKEQIIASDINQLLRKLNEKFINSENVSDFNKASNAYKYFLNFINGIGIVLDNTTVITYTGGVNEDNCTISTNGVSISVNVVGNNGIFGPSHQYGYRTYNNDVIDISSNTRNAINAWNHYYWDKCKNGNGFVNEELFAKYQKFFDEILRDFITSIFNRDYNEQKGSNIAKEKLLSAIFSKRITFSNIDQLLDSVLDIKYGNENSQQKTDEKNNLKSIFIDVVKACLSVGVKFKGTKLQTNANIYYDKKGVLHDNFNGIFASLIEIEGKKKKAIEESFINQYKENNNGKIPDKSLVLDYLYSVCAERLLSKIEECSSALNKQYGMSLLFDENNECVGGMSNKSSSDNRMNIIATEEKRTNGNEILAKDFADKETFGYIKSSKETNDGRVQIELEVPKIVNGELTSDTIIIYADKQLRGISAGKIMSTRLVGLDGTRINRVWETPRSITEKSETIGLLKDGKLSKEVVDKSGNKQLLNTYEFLNSIMPFFDDSKKEPKLGDLTDAIKKFYGLFSGNNQYGFRIVFGPKNKQLTLEDFILTFDEISNDDPDGKNSITTKDKKNGGSEIKNSPRGTVKNARYVAFIPLIKNDNGEFIEAIDVNDVKKFRYDSAKTPAQNAIDFLDSLGKSIKITDESKVQISLNDLTPEGIISLSEKRGIDLTTRDNNAETYVKITKANDTIKPSNEEKNVNVEQIKTEDDDNEVQVPKSQEESNENNVSDGASISSLDNDDTKPVNEFLNIQRLNDEAYNEFLDDDENDKDEKEDNEENNLPPFLEVSIANRNTKYEKINIKDEVNWLLTKLPQFVDDVEIIEGLIKARQNGKIAYGQFVRGMLKISNVATRGTVYHEAFHAVFNTILSDKERSELYNEAKDKYNVKYEDGMTKDEIMIAESKMEELLAEDFRLYVMSSRKEQSERPKGIRGFFNRIKNFINKLFKRNKYKNEYEGLIGKVFERINTGKYAKNNHWISNGRVLSISEAFSLSGNSKYKNNQTSMTFDELKNDIDDLGVSTMSKLVYDGWFEDDYNNLSLLEKKKVLECL